MREQKKRGKTTYKNIKLINIKKPKKQISNNELFLRNSSFQQQANSTHKTQHIAYNLQKKSVWL